MSVDIETVRAGLRDEAVLREALAGLPRRTVREAWKTAGEVTSAKHRGGVAAWAREKPPAAAFVVFATWVGRDGLEWSDQGVYFHNADGRKIGRYDSKDNPALVALLTWLTDAEPPAYQGDELAVDLGEAETEEGDPWAVSASGTPETRRG
ncbi:hypothetical protein ABZT26_36070 [Streptomyces sp. NPDC005395]|uniref:hypothetical protein n=1 Tax=Streptomyces sp. NPDC005395 TaxID=3157042 RepID=UPI0033A77485